MKNRLSQLTDWAGTHRVPLLLAAIHWLSTFYLETLFLEVPRSAHWGNYLICKLLVLAALYGFWNLLWAGLTRKGSAQRAILCYMLPCLAVLVIWLLTHHSFTLIKDELAMYLKARQLDNYASWFVCYTGFYWISSLMILPTMMGPVYIKIFLQALVCGYCVYRARRCFNSRWALLLYGLFLLPELLTHGISAHRMPTYGVLYLFFAAQLLFDFLERQPLSRKKLIWLSAVAAVLTHWRSEGIYLLVLGWILILLAYRVKGKRAVARVLLFFYCIHAVVFLPQYAESFGEDSRYLNLRMQTMYAYSIVNMHRNGLDTDQCREQLDAMAAVTPLEGIEYVNETLGDTNYVQVYLLTDANPYLVDGYSKDDLNDFCNAARSIIFQQPLVFLKAQLKAWQYTSEQLVVSFEFGLLGAAFNLLSRPLYPFLLVGLFWLAALIRRKWMTFFLTSGVLGNWAIVVLLMPAAYTKYFYVIYLMGYFLLFLYAISGLSRRSLKGLMI